MQEKSAVVGLVRDLEGWAGRFFAAASAGDLGRTDEAVAGLVEWLGHDLVDAFFAVDVPTWEALSGLAEEVLQGLRAAQAGVRAAGGGPWPGLPGAEAAVQAVLERARAIREAGERPCR